MNKISFFLILLVSQLSFSQQSIKFEDSDFASILAKAKAEKKIVFLDAYAAWCGPCKLMERNVFTDKNVADIITKTSSMPILIWKKVKVPVWLQNTASEVIQLYYF